MSSLLLHGKSASTAAAIYRRKRENLWAGDQEGAHACADDARGGAAMKDVIYGLFCPIVGAVRYIGKSCQPQKRMYAHIYAASPTGTWKDRWIAKLLSDGLKPSMVILEELADGVRWQDAESRWIAIALAKGWPITNTAAGGNGSSPLNEAARALKFARMADPETRRKMSESAKARWQDKEKRGRAIAGLQNRDGVSEKAKTRATPEYRAMMSARSKAAWASPERRARIISGITEETKAAVAESAKRMWATANAEKKARMLGNLLAGKVATP